MRFASLGGSSTSDYAAAGKAAADSAATSFAIQRKTGPNYGDLSKAAMVVDAQKFNASAKASAKVARAGIKAYSDVTRTGQAVKVFEKKNEIANKQRKAGGLAAIGKIAGAGFLAATDNTKGRERPKSDLQGLLDTHKSDMAGLKTRQQSERDSLTPFKPVASGGSAGKVTGADGTLTSSAQAVAAGKGTGGNGNTYNMDQMTTMAQQAGFSPDDARTMAAISMGESGGNAGIDTVQSGLDPNKSNEYSIGVTQINTQAHGDKLTRRGWSNEDLRDPVKNFTIAKEVYDERGSFEPWSVYQKGLHQQYLN